MSSRFSEIGKCALPACSEGSAPSAASPPRAEGLKSPRGFPECEKRAPGPRVRRRRALGKEPNFEGQSGKPGQWPVNSYKEPRPGRLGSPRRLLGLEG